jgi:hypothetical protein
MSYNDVEIARMHYRGMRDLIIHNAGGWKDEQALELMRAFCRRAHATLEDRSGRLDLAAIEDYAAALWSESDHRRWNRNRLSGADFLRLQILRQLDRFAERLDVLEMERSGAMRAAGREGDPKLPDQ